MVKLSILLGLLAALADIAGGLVLVLQNSHWARVRFARAKRRWPKIGGYADRVLRRASARRRRERAATLAAQPASESPPR